MPRVFLILPHNFYLHQLALIFFWNKHFLIVKPSPIHSPMRKTKHLLLLNSQTIWLEWEEEGKRRHYLTEHFTILKPQTRWIYASHVLRKNQSTDFEALMACVVRRVAWVFSLEWRVRTNMHHSFSLLFCTQVLNQESKRRSLWVQSKCMQKKKNMIIIPLSPPPSIIFWRLLLLLSVRKKYIHRLHFWRFEAYPDELIIENRITRRFKWCNASNYTKNERLLLSLFVDEETKCSCLGLTFDYVIFMGEQLFGSK